MRWSGLAGCCALVLASQALVACGDDEDDIPGATAGRGGSSSGSGGKAGGSGGKAGGSSTAGTAGMPGGNGGAAGEGGMDTGGTAGTGGTPMCAKDLDCFADTNDCTVAKCVDGKCEQEADDAATCTDGNDCTDDVCDAGECKSTNNTGDCDDNNDCTDDDACVAGACVGSNNTDACDDVSSCTTGDTCAGGACVGARDVVLCPACDTDDNLIKNCDFSDMLTSWATSIAFEGGQATQSVVNERDVIDITAGGPKMYAVQPRQEPLSLKQGFRYEFGLVAGSNLPRDAVVSLTQAAGMYTPYSTGDSAIKDGFVVALEPQMKPFNFEFLMTEPDDANVKLEIKIGGPEATANQTYFDDVYVREVKCALPADCNDGNPCTDDACDVVSGKCGWTNNTATCDSDDESCTAQVCEEGECKVTALADDTACESDGSSCTSDVCKTGVCSYPTNNTCACLDADDCDDANPCTADTCTPATGACVSTPVTLACDDNDICTNADMCGAGSCGGTNACFANCATGNLAKNCDMATATADWFLYQGGGAASNAFADGLLSTTVTAAGVNDYDIQLLQGGIVLAPGKTYRIKLNAIATSARKIIVGLTQNGDAYTTYFATPALDVGTTMGQFTFDYTTPADFVAPTAMIKLEIRLGGAANNLTLPNTISFDNVSISEVVVP